MFAVLVRYSTPKGHIIIVHPERPGVESAYVSVTDADGRFLANYPMDSTREALKKAPVIVFAYTTGQVY